MNEVGVIRVRTPRSGRESRHPGWVSALLILACSAISVPSTSVAQSRQYRAPGPVEDYGGKSTLEQLEDAIEEAPWRAGRLYAAPWYSLREISYDERESSTSRSDLKVSAGVGVRGFLPFGARYVLAGHALPEAVWWRDRDGRSTLNGRYGLGLFGRSGRFGVETSATRDSDSRFFSREFEQRVDTTDDQGKLRLELSLSPSVALFTSGAVRELDFDDDGRSSGVSQLSRDEEVFRGGVRLRLPRGVVMGLGVESMETDFQDPFSLRSNSGTSPTFELMYEGPRLLTRVDLVARDFEPDRGPRRIAYDEVVGEIRTRFSPTTFPIQIEPFLLRDVVYSRSDTWAYYEEAMVGLNLIWRSEGRVTLTGFLEDGTNDYRAFEVQILDREDDFFTYGGDLAVRLGRVTLGLRVSRTEFESNLPSFTRDKNRLSFDVSFGRRSRNPWY